jgi:adenylate cyclase, class 2
MNTEIEARFLEIDKETLIERLITLDAADKGEILLSEVIFYDAAGTWQEEGRYTRLRSLGEKTILTYKENKKQTIDSAKEIEFEVSDEQQALLLLETLGLKASRHQEKRRHTFTLNDVTVDIDTWPNIPTYVELEGPSEDSLRQVAQKLSLDWSTVVFDDARAIIQNRYNIPVSTLSWFTFDRCE